MPIDQLANYAEIFGGIAVIISLVYVALQVRANTREQKLQRAMERNETFTRAQSDLVNNRELREVWIKGRKGLSNLDEQERIAFGAYMSQWLGFNNAYFTQYKAGALPKEMQEISATSARMITAYPGTFEWWQRARDTVPADYRAYVDDMFEQTREWREQRQLRADNAN